MATEDSKQKDDKDSKKKDEFTFKVKKQLIFPVLRMEQHIPIFVQIIGVIYVGKEVKSETTDKKKQNEKPADLCHIINLETGEAMMIVVPAIVKSVLEETYEKESYVDLKFKIVKGEKAEGRRYFFYKIDEIE